MANGQTNRSWAAPVDVVRDGEDVVVRVSLPGIGPDDIRVTLEEGVLTVRGETGKEREQENGYLTRERRTGSFYRAIRLPDSVANHVMDQFGHRTRSYLPSIEDFVAEGVQ